MDAKRLLLVEDDRGLGALVAEYLQQSGFVVDWVQDGAVAERQIRESPPDLVVLDLMLPGMDGHAVCRAVRPAYAGPILMMTARGDEADQVLGLEFGADDYVNKPISPRLLLARVKALLRRGGGEPVAARRIVDGPLIIDLSRREVRYEARCVELTTAQFDLLWAIASHPGVPMSRQALFQALRGIDYDGLDRAMDTRMSQLRKRLVELTGGVDPICTVRGVGYQYVGLPR